MDFSHPAMVQARNLGRLLGLSRLVQRTCRRLRGSSYEERFARLTMSRISPGDVVWDVGANVGLYTRQFAERVGKLGHVVAFEPSPGTFRTLRSAMADYPNVTCVNTALADFEGQADFHVDSNANNPTDSLVSRGTGTHGAIRTVAVRTGDGFVAEHPELRPNKIKIDVEGFEYEVLAGLRAELGHPALDGLFMEIHFSVLAARGLSGMSARIVEVCRSNGFFVRWPDASHLCAHRSAHP